MERGALFLNTYDYYKRHCAGTNRIPVSEDEFYDCEWCNPEILQEYFYNTAEELKDMMEMDINKIMNSPLILFQNLLEEKDVDLQVGVLDEKTGFAFCICGCGGCFEPEDFKLIANLGTLENPIDHGL